MHPFKDLRFPEALELRHHSKVLIHCELRPHDILLVHYANVTLGQPSCSIELSKIIAKHLQSSCSPLHGESEHLED